MRGVTYDRYGQPAEVLKIADRPELSPKNGEVVVAVRRVPVHPGDLLGIEGRYRKPGDKRDPEPESGRPGLEGMGVVLSRGSGVDDRLRPGTRVAFFPVSGAWAQQVVVASANVVELPDDIDDGIGAQMLINSLTAAMLVRELVGNGARAGHKVVFSAAGSSVAKLAMHIAIQIGMEPVAIIRTSSGSDAVHSEFPDMPVVATDQADWGEALANAVGDRAIRAAVDPVGGQVAGELLARLGDRGHFISYGDLSGDPIPVPPLALPTRGLTMSGVNVGTWSALPSGLREADLKTAVGLGRDFKGLFPVAATFDMDDVQAAVRMVRKEGRRGTVLLAIPGNKE